MECSCEVDTYGDDSGSVSLYTRKIVKARKTHKCSECHCDIDSGAKYEVLSYLFEGEFWRDKTCLDCVAAKEQFFPNGGYCSGGMWTEIEEHVNDSSGEIPESCIAKLTPVAQSRVCDFVENVI